METKQKPCKGTGIAKGNGCQKSVFKRTLGLCQSCYAKWLLNTPEGRERLQKHTLKAQQPRLEVEKAYTEKKERLKLQSLINSTKQVCHEYIRLRDKGKPCISCGALWNDNFEAGHYAKAELYPAVRFNELNIHGQCIQCNRYKHGNETAYRAGLEVRLCRTEMAKLQAAIFYAKKEGFKWDREELERIKNDYKFKLKQLKQ